MTASPSASAKAVVGRSASAPSPVPTGEAEVGEAMRPIVASETSPSPVLTGEGWGGGRKS
jgi:hypothetical protein